MLPAQKLENVLSQLTMQQYSRLLAFAEALAAENAPPDSKATVTEMRQRLEQSFPEPLRLRLRALSRKLEAETISDSERAELAALAEQSERATVARLEAVAQLVKQHGISRQQALAALNQGTKRRG